MFSYYQTDLNKIVLKNDDADTEIVTLICEGHHFFTPDNYSIYMESPLISYLCAVHRSSFFYYFCSFSVKATCHIGHEIEMRNGPFFRLATIVCFAILTFQICDTLEPSTVRSVVIHVGREDGIQVLIDASRSPAHDLLLQLIR